MFTRTHLAAALAYGTLALSTAAQAVTLDELKKDGPFTIVSEKLAGSGYGSATIHTPKTGGPYALVAVCPGFVSPESSIAQISKRLATHGFSVITIATTTLLDFPPSRASQILAALDAGVKVNTGNAAGKVDSSRLVASGWSMGGGGTLLAAAKTPRLKAAVAYAPWNTQNSPFKAITVPTMIFGATGDIIAPAKTHAITFYNAIPSTTKKALAVLQGDNHFFPTTADDPVSYTNIAFNKRFADGNTEYGQFIKNLDAKWASYESTGPF
ncbi:MAG: dienelactone hydrolase family protein [Aquabacterium sp.]